MREIDNIVVLGLRGPGTVEQLPASFNNQMLSADEHHTQKVAITQLEMAFDEICARIQTTLSHHEAVDLYICDIGLTEDITPALQELGFTVLGHDDLPHYINENSLVYDVTMDSDELEDAVFGWEGEVMFPAAIITPSLTPNRAGDV